MDRPVYDNEGARDQVTAGAVESAVTRLVTRSGGPIRTTCRRSAAPVPRGKHDEHGHRLRVDQEQATSGSSRRGCWWNGTAPRPRSRPAAPGRARAGGSRPGDDAIPYASRAVALNPLEEGNHELLIRSLATAGDRAAAEHEQQIAVCEDLLRRALGRRVTGSHVGGPQECACPRGARSGRGRRWSTILTTRRGPYWRIWLASRLDAIFANW